MAKILVVDDAQTILDTLEIFLRRRGHTVSTASTGSEGLTLFYQRKPDVVILDIRLPDLSGLDVLSRIQSAANMSKVIMITAFQDMESTIEAMKQGAFDYLRKPLDITKVENVLKKALSAVEAERHAPKSESEKPAEAAAVLIGQSEPMLDIFKMIGVCCQNQAPVLIHGETGTGKGVIARMIHRNSQAAKEPFMVLDCSAAVESLIESELFGHERGAFTGAQRTRQGKIERAGKGVLFLDEIGELPASIQGKFLGFLQNREYMRVGGARPLRAECRIIAATNRDLAGMVAQGIFREDLYYRLKVVTIRVPPLRERLADLPLLVEHFLRTTNQQFGAAVSQYQEGVLDYLAAQPWPGNIRQLENTLIAAVMRTRGKVLLLEDVKNVAAAQASSVSVARPAPAPQILTKELLEQVLAEVGDNRSEAARRLGISRPTLRKKMKAFGL